MKKIYTLCISALIFSGAIAKTKTTVKEKEAGTNNPKTVAKGVSRAAAIWEDHFTSAVTWTITKAMGATDWAIGVDQQGAGQYSIGPMNATGTATPGDGNALFDSDNGCDGDQDASLTNATAIDLTGHSQVRLTFNELYRWWFDSTYVEVSGDNGVTWTVHQLHAGFTNDQMTANPENVIIDISAEAGNQSQVFVRFRFNSTQAKFGTNGGCAYNWLIDDVIIEDLPSVEVQALGIVFPSPDCDLSNAETVKVSAKNNGSTTITSLDFDLSMNGSTPVVETVAATLAPGETMEHTFAATLDMSAPFTLFSIAAGVTTSGDANLDNNVDSGYTVKLIPDVDTLLNTFSAGDGSELIGWSMTHPTDWYYSGNEHTGDAIASWAYNNGGSILTADEWIFSTCIDMSAINTYIFSFWANVPTLGTGEWDANYEAFLSTDQSPTASMMSIGTGLINSSTYTEFIHSFQPTNDGTYVMAVHFTNGTMVPWFRTDDYSISWDRTVGVAKTNASKIGLYPNPSTGLVTVNATAKTSVEVISVVGTSVYKTEVAAGKSQLNLSNLANGNYIVKLNDGTTNTTERLVINK